jgi:ankyrin repeat protein
MKKLVRDGLALGVLLAGSLIAFAATAEEQLLAAAKQGRTAEVARLVAEGANVEGPARSGNQRAARLYARNSPLIVAAAGGYVDTVKLLLDHGAKVQPGGEGAENALTAAAESGHIAVVVLLLDRGAPMEARNATYSTALLMATGQLEMMRLLIARGANVNVRNKYGNAPLNAAAYAGNAEAVQLLLAHGADVNNRTRFGVTPLGAAACDALPEHTSEADRVAVVKLLLAHGADPSAEDRFGHSPRNCALAREIAAMAKVIDAAVQQQTTPSSQR